LSDEKDAGALGRVFPPPTKQQEENRFIALRNLANEMREKSYEELWAKAEKTCNPLTVLEQYYLRRFRIETKTQDNAYLNGDWRVALKVCDDLEPLFPTKVTKGMSKIPMIGKKVFVKGLIRTVLSKEERKFVRETMARIRYGQRPIQESYGQLAQSNERWDVVQSKIKTKAGCHKDTVLTIQRSFREDSSKEWEQDVEQYQFRYSKMKNLIHKLNKKIKKKVKKSLQQKEYDMATRKWIMYDDFQNQIGGHYLAKLSTHQSDGFFGRIVRAFNKAARKGTVQERQVASTQEFLDALRADPEKMEAFTTIMTRPQKAADLYGLKFEDLVAVHEVSEFHSDQD